MKNKILIAALCSLVFIVGCSSVVDDDAKALESLKAELEAKETESIDPDLKLLKDKVAEQKIKIESLEDLNLQYKAYLEKVVDILDDSQLMELSKSGIYSLKVNGKDVPKDGVVEVSDKTIDIIITENIEDLSYLPSSIPEHILLGNYPNHIIIKGYEDMEPITMEPITLDGTIVTSAQYSFWEDSNVDELTVEITNELRDILKLDTNTIKIIRN